MKKLIFVTDHHREKKKKKIYDIDNLKALMDEKLECRFHGCFHTKYLPRHKCTIKQKKAKYVVWHIYAITICKWAEKSCVASLRGWQGNRPHFISILHSVSNTLSCSSSQPPSLVNISCHQSGFTQITSRSIDAAGQLVLFGFNWQQNSQANLRQNPYLIHRS